MKPNRKSITIHDVAKAAGVSVSTVSRVLNKKGDVAAETIDRVQSVIHEMDYASSLAARGLRSQRTNVIGLIMPDVGTPYCYEVLRGVNKVIAGLDFDLLIYTTGDVKKYGTSNQERHYVALLNGSIADGVIVVTPVATDFSANAPVVAIDPNNESPKCPGIIAANCEGVIAAMNYLTGLGHRRIGFITGRLDLVSGCQRLQGYKEGLVASGIELDEALIKVGDYTSEVARDCTRALLALEDRPTAIFASNDMSAWGVYQAAEEAGLLIPDDLSVMGFDNLPDSTCFEPALTTVDQFVADMGSIATEMITKLIKGEILEQNLLIIPTQLIIRESCTSILSESPSS